MIGLGPRSDSVPSRARHHLFTARNSDHSLTATMVEVATWMYGHQRAHHASDPRGPVGNPSRLTLPPASPPTPTCGRAAPKATCCSIRPRRTTTSPSCKLGGVAPVSVPSRRGRTHVARIASQFDARLHAPAAELVEIGRHAHMDVPMGSRPRHQRRRGDPHPGAFPRQYELPGARRFRRELPVHRRHHLPRRRRRWAAGYLPGWSDAAQLLAA